MATGILVGAVLVLLAIVCAVIGWREFRSYAAGDIRARLHQADTSVTDAFRAARRPRSPRRPPSRRRGDPGTTRRALPRDEPRSIPG